MSYVLKYGEFIKIELIENDIIRVRDDFNSFECQFKRDDLQDMIVFFGDIPDKYDGCYTECLDDYDYESYQRGDIDTDEIKIWRDLDYLSYIKSNYFVLGRYQIMVDALKEFESIAGSKNLKSLLKEYREKRKTK